MHLLAWPIMRQGRGRCSDPATACVAHLAEPTRPRPLSFSETFVKSCVRCNYMVSIDHAMALLLHVRAGALKDLTPYIQQEPALKWTDIIPVGGTCTGSRCGFSAGLTAWLRGAP